MAIPVKAIQRGYYGLQLREKGDSFTIKDASEMGKWMVVVKASVHPDDADEAPEKAPAKASPGGKSKAGTRASDESKI